MKRSTYIPTDQPGRIQAVGIALFGSAYRKRLATGLGISRSTLHLWLAGARTNRDVDSELIALLDNERDACAERSIQITALRRQLIDGSRRARI